MMLQTISIGAQLTRRHGLWAMAMSAYLCAAVGFLGDYLPFHRISFYLPILAAAFLFRKSEQAVPTARLPLLALLTAGVGMLIPVSTFFYFSMVLAIVSLIEWKFGAQSPLLLVALLSASPVVAYWIDIFTFPLRLWLSQMAAILLRLFDSDSVATGTYIVFQNKEYQIDTGCMGLYMFLMAFQAGLLMLAIQSKYRNNSIRSLHLMLFVVAIFLFSVLANFIRIIILVVFDWRSGTLMHEVAGLGCFALYVLYPCWHCAGWLLTKNMKPVFAPTFPGNKSKLVRNLQLFLPVVFGFQLYQLQHVEGSFLTADSVCRQYGIDQSDIASPGVYRHVDGDFLVYVKQVRGFFDTDHQPMICWKGSGYEFGRLYQKKLFSQEVYISELSKGETLLYTAWWYDNGESRTVSAWQWRWAMLKGAAPYALVNVTATSVEQLDEWLCRNFSK